MLGSVAVSSHCVFAQTWVIARRAARLTELLTMTW